MCKNNSRFSSKIKCCRPSQPLCYLIGLKLEIGCYSYTDVVRNLAIVKIDKLVLKPKNVNEIPIRFNRHARFGSEKYHEQKCPTS